MIRRLVDFALTNRFVVLVFGLLLLAWGAISFHNLPVEAYPDVANTYVQVITQWPGHAAEEVEQQVTIPVETGVAGVPRMTNMRSVSLFGLSVVTLTFEDGADTLLARQLTLEKISQINLPAGLQPGLGPNFSPTGQIYFYTLVSTNPRYDVMELKALNDWLVVKQLKSVPNIIDVSSFGGTTREYQVQVNPDQLISYGLSISQVEQALAANNVNAGGSFIESGQQALNVRAVGLMEDTADIGATVLKTVNGTPVRVRDVAVVTQGPKIRLGQLGKSIRRENGHIIDRPDVVEGIVLMLKGAVAETTMKDLEDKIKDLNAHYLPQGVRIVPHIDRADLMHYTTHTVLHNLTEGIILVILILFIFLGNLRSALIVALTIPFSLLFASILLDLNHVPANLLSLGALDFGMVVDGAVVMVENILRHIARYEADEQMTLTDRIRVAAHEVQRPVFYAIGIIITAYLPIFTLQRVEGRLFRPMALTVAFALLGALVFSLLLAPVLASFFFTPRTREWRNPVLDWLIRTYEKSLRWSFRHGWLTTSGTLLAVAGTFWLVGSGRLGSEFLPHLDEGAIWARGTLAPSIGPTESTRIMREARLTFASFPEVTQVVSQVGRSDDGTDATGFFNTEYFVDLKPRDQWRPEFRTKEDLIAAIDQKLEHIPGVLWNYSQPIADNVEEAVSGVKGQSAVKLYGTDLKELESTAEKIVAVMSKVQGVADLGIFRVVGQPNLNLAVNRSRTERFGLNVADVQDAVETAIGGKAVSQILKGDRRFDLVVRYQEPYRHSIEDIRDIRLLAPSGERVSLAQVCDVKVEDGANMIYREANERFIAIKYSVRGRDLGSTVNEAMTKVAKQVKLPEGYHTEWVGEFESAQRANRRLALIVPLTILIIFMLLYSAFSSIKWSLLILVNIVLAPVGGVLALLATGTHFSVSSGIGFLALFGVSVQTGVIMVEYINQLRVRGQGIADAALHGAVRRLRPIMMTMLVATLGLLPAALSHGIGSDSQRPFAIVIVGGLIVDLLFSVIVLPTLYQWVAGANDVLPHHG